ncbi:MAG: uracil phosphoribosyltransferase [Bdellovibrionaceae bacterium]|nr:uracil phosphoribosyltransferase [Pseudobdellovibrionaceae bacterium]
MSQKIVVLDHPLLQHKLGYLRDKSTNSPEFRDLMSEISSILAFEAMRDWKELQTVAIETPVASAQVQRVSNPPIVVSILRAGNGMLDAVLKMIPFAGVGFIGIYRDKFIHNTVEYYFKMPAETKGKTAILCDPLISTADTVIAAIDRLKSHEVGQIRIVCVLISEYACQKLQNFHPDVEIYTLNIEKQINDVGYLVPGLGDAGDRLYHTK